MRRSKNLIPPDFLGAFKAGQRPGTQEYLDDEFAHELLDRIIASNYQDAEAIAHLKYLAQFNDEFEKDFIRTTGREPLHATEAERLELHRRNNARNRDVFSRENSNLKRFAPTDSEGEVCATIDSLTYALSAAEVEDHQLESIILSRKIERNELELPESYLDTDLAWMDGIKRFSPEIVVPAPRKLKAKARKKKARKSRV